MESFKDWFRNSKVVDNNGNPIKVYHGTNAVEDFKEFKLMGYDLGIHFGTIEHANNRIYKIGELNNSRIMPVYLKIENPLEMYQDVFTGVPWSFFRKICSDSDYEPILTLEEEDFIMDKYGKDFELSDYTYTDNDAEFYNDIMDMIISKGYDGIKYFNEIEVTNGYNKENPYSWVVFNPSQVKNALQCNNY